MLVSTTDGLGWPIRVKAMEDKKGWLTTMKRDMSQFLNEPFYSTNPEYVKSHKEWDWIECEGDLAEREVYRQMHGQYPQEGA